MAHDGWLQYYLGRIEELWNQRNDPEVFNQIMEYIDKIEVYSDNPSIKKELRRTKIILENENKLIKNFPSSTKAQNIIETDGDLPVKIEDFFVVEKPNTTFDKIGGLNEVKETLKMEVIYPFIFPEKYQLYGRRCGCGILLWGPPGVGKTLLAKAVARESNLTVFIAPKVSDIMNRWVGQSEKIIAAIFEYAKKCGKATLFFDEVDYIARRSGPSYMMRIKRELLSQMDGVTSKKNGLLVLGATNQPWALDPAVRRPSPEGVRFSKIILVPPPDLEARKEIFRIHLSKVNQEMIAEDVNLDELAKLTHGYSGADIGAIIEAAIDIPLKEYLRGAPPRPVCMDDFLKAISAQPKSILPWLTDALKSVKRYGEQFLAEQLTKLFKEYTYDEGDGDANSL